MSGNAITFRLDKISLEQLKAQAFDGESDTFAAIRLILEQIKAGGEIRQFASEEALNGTRLRFRLPKAQCEWIDARRGQSSIHSHCRDLLTTRLDRPKTPEWNLSDLRNCILSLKRDRISAYELREAALQHCSQPALQHYIKQLEMENFVERKYWDYGKCKEIAKSRPNETFKLVSGLFQEKTFEVLINA